MKRQLHSPLFSRQHGLTLVEILVALTISLLLLAGIVQVFIGNKNTYRLQEGLSRMQESGRFITEYLARNIRSAGYMGCLSRNAPVTNTLNNADTSPYDFEQGLEGFEANGTAPNQTYTLTATNPEPATTGSGWTPNLPPVLAGKVIPGTDVIVIRGAEDNDVEVTKNNDSAQLFARNTGVEKDACPDPNDPTKKIDRISGLCIGDILVVSDCQKARVFQLTNLTSTGSGNTEINVVHSNANFTPGNAESSWGGNSTAPDESFGPGSSILKVSTRYFFIGRRAAAGGEPAGPPSLYMQSGTAAAQELVENVESMQILYGRDTDGNGAADEYVTAASAPASGTTAYREWWNSIVSARIAVLVRSDQEADTETNSATYALAGTTIDPVDDRRLRQVFTTTVTIRNSAR